MLRILAECKRVCRTPVIILSVCQTRTKNHRCHSIRFPLNTKIGRKRSSLIAIGILGILERAGSRRNECFRSLLADNVRILVVIIHTTSCFQFLTLCTKVETTHLDAGQTVLSSPTKATASSRIAVIIHIIH